MVIGGGNQSTRVKPPPCPTVTGIFLTYITPGESLRPSTATGHQCSISTFSMVTTPCTSFFLSLT